MIVGAQTETAVAGPTLDDLFRRAAVRSPEAIALADPADRARFIGGEPRQLTYAEADRTVWAIAARLRALGLQTDSVIGSQLPNTVESALTLLGILRAGMIAAPLPMLWRETEIVAALSGVGAKALISASRIGDTDHFAVAGRVAAGLFSIRHVCGYGAMADGIVPLDDSLTAHGEMQPAPQRDGDPAAHAAIVTFEPTPRGLVPVARNHAQLIAAGLAVTAAGALPQDAVLLAATPPSSFAGLAVTFMPWLMSGGRLVLHQPFDATSFREQAHAHECDAVVVPGPLAAAFDDLPARTTLFALWRAPERLDPAPLHRNIIDITAFGEFGLHAAPRGNDGRMAAFAFEQTRRSAKGTLLLHGAMVAGPGFDTAEPNDATHGFVDTHYPCRVDAERGTLIVTAPQPGMVGIGGYRIARSEIDAFTAALPTDSPIAALPDQLLGQRLRGRAADPSAAMRAARAVNPLIAGAFAN